MRRPPAPGSDGPEQRSLEDKLPGAFAENPSFSAKRKGILKDVLFWGAGGGARLHPRYFKCSAEVDFACLYVGRPDQSVRHLFSR